MSDFKINYLGNPRIKNPILIAGLPGIGNVGKVTVDFLIDSLGAKKFAEVSSYYFPSSVFVTEDNLISLPQINLYFKRTKEQDVILLAGDVQPIDERSCYLFCEEILNVFEKYGGKEIITIGGIGLQKIPKVPKLYITGTDQAVIRKYKFCLSGIYGVVGPILGVSGVLVGLAGRRKIPAVSLLAQTFAHPAYLGIKGAREALKSISARLGVKLDIKRLDKEIEDLESELRVKTQQLVDLKESMRPKSNKENYFG
ncbi:MAG: PAC2 family protein [archaeon]